MCGVVRGNELSCYIFGLELLTLTFDFVLSGKNRNQVSGLYQARCMLSWLALRHICESRVLGEELKGGMLLATSA